MKINEKYVQRLERKVASSEATLKWMLKVQRSSLADAEKLRKLGKAVTSNTRSVGEGYVVRAKALEVLADFVAKLTPFYEPLPKRTEAKVQKFLKGAKPGKEKRK